MPYLPAFGVRADTYPALHAARRHLRQTCRSFSNPEAGTEMRVTDAIAPGSQARYLPPEFAQKNHYCICFDTMTHCNSSRYCLFFRFLCLYQKFCLTPFEPEFCLGFCLHSGLDGAKLQIHYLQHLVKRHECQGHQSHAGGVAGHPGS